MYENEEGQMQKPSYYLEFPVYLLHSILCVDSLI